MLFFFCFYVCNGIICFLFLPRQRSSNIVEQSFMLRLLVHLFDFDLIVIDLSLSMFSLFIIRLCFLLCGSFLFLSFPLYDSHNIGTFSLLQIYNEELYFFVTLIRIQNTNSLGIFLFSIIVACFVVVSQADLVVCFYLNQRVMAIAASTKCSIRYKRQKNSTTFIPYEIHTCMHFHKNIIILFILQFFLFS